MSKTLGQIAYEALATKLYGSAMTPWSEIQEYHDGWEAAVKAVAERCAQIAANLTGDDTRKALGANAVIVASQIENAIRSLINGGEDNG